MSFFEFVTEQAKKLNHYITKDVTKSIEDLSFLELEITRWKNSPQRQEALQGFLYYEGYQDILNKKRTAIGRGGEVVELDNLPNRHDIDNQYALAVDKKANYMLGKPIAFVSDNKAYAEALEDVFDMGMMKTLKNMAKKSLEGAICWVMPYYDKLGQFKVKTFPSYEILPFWTDAEHKEIDYAVRLYQVLQYKGTEKKLIEKVEVYKHDGVYRYTFEGSTLKPDNELGAYESYMALNGVAYNWDRMPLIPFKYNDAEIPLIRRVKALQDALNELMSLYHNNMLEDSRNTILVIENYDGQDLGEFRNNLAQYGAIKVRSGDGARGGVSTLQVEVNSENYDNILKTIKEKLVENARSFDGKMLNSGTPNQMNILSMYQDIDIDTNDFESEYQSSLHELLYFVNVHLSLTGKGNYFEDDVEIVFNRDMLMNESEIMTTLIQSGVKISNKTLLSQVPFIGNVDEELKQIKKENEEAIDDYAMAFQQNGDIDGEDDEGSDSKSEAETK